MPLHRAPRPLRLLARLAFPALLAFAAASARAAGTPRHAHAAVLLPNDDILLIGGINDSGTNLSSVEFVRTSRGGASADAASMSAARSSHTATLLPNGRVLVTGGWDGGTGARSSAEVFDPSTLAWSATANAMSASRLNHTATLLQDGRVLVCGGQTSLSAPAVTASCDLYDPASNSFSAAASLQLARSLHTAVLLRDGKVWFAGGWNPSSSPAYLATTERYNPSSGGAGFFNSAAPLAQARAYHTATAMGDGKILIAGGHNGDNTFVNGNGFGILPSAEIYDPVGNGMTPAASMNTRRQMHAAALSADGSVVLEGGLGGVTTTYLRTEISGQALVAGSSLTLSFSPPTDALSTGTISGGSLSLALDFPLSVKVAGVIEDGEILLSTPAIAVAGAFNAYLTPGNIWNSADGLRIPLNGVAVACTTESPADCGRIKATLPMSNLSGRVFFKEMTGVAPAGAIPPLITVGSITYSPSPLAAGENATVTGGTFTVTMTVIFNSAFAGATISSGSFRLTSASLVKTSSFTATFSDGFGTFSGQTVSLNPTTGKAEASLTVAFSNLTGIVVADSAAQAVASPQGLTGIEPTLSGNIRHVMSRALVGGEVFTVDVATVVVRRMLFGSPEYYNPQANQWSLTPAVGRSGASSSRAVIGPTATRLRNNDLVVAGGRACADASCSSFVSKNSGGTRTDLAVLDLRANWKTSSVSIGQKRALHTATSLPDGTILLAGGTNGPNVLRSAEVFDPASLTDSAIQAFTPTRVDMHQVRDLHTATLLPNGRVLLAGGFTTNATSTGSTNTAEIYYPDTKVFLPAEVMSSSRSNHTAALLPGGAVLVAGGFGPNDVITATAEIFYSTSGAWRDTASMPGGGRALHTATTLRDGRVMLAGGVSPSGILSSVVAYSATAGWSTLASMPQSLRSHTATLLLDGRVLVAGGNNGLGEVDASYIYDPVSDSWSSTYTGGTSGSLLQPRFNHNAILLPNGNVMISGGVQRFGNVTDEIEVFHTGVSSWAAGGVRFDGTPARRAFHTMTLAPDGRLFAFGGSDGNIGGTGVQLWGPYQHAYFTADPDLYTKGVSAASPSVRRSSVTSAGPSPILPSAALTVVGSSFLGGTEASGGGAAAAHSSFSLPRLLLQALDGSGGAASQSNSGFIADLSTQVFLNSSNLATLNSSVTATLPASAALPYGWYHARVGVNGLYSGGVALQVGPPRPSAAPGAPAGSALGASSVAWSWSSVSGADGYAVYQATTGVFLGTAAAASFVQSGLSSNTTASIRVAAYTITGDGPLSPSATVYSLAAAPASLSVSSVGFSGLRLAWSANGNSPATLYEVSQSTDNFAASFSTPVPSVLGLATDYALIGNLVANTTYYFRVRAFNGAGAASAFSASVSTRTRAPVSALAGTPLDTTRVQWSWIDPGGVLSYRVYNSTSGELLATPSGNLYTDVGLSTNSPRSVAVSAVTDAGEGPLAYGATVYTHASVPGAVSPALLNVTTGSFSALWDPNGNPASTRYRYTVYQVGTSSIPVLSITAASLAQGAGSLTPATLYLASVTAVNENGLVTAPLVLGTTYTLPVPPANLAALGTSPSEIALSWGSGGNGSDVQYQVTYSTDGFAAHVATAVFFAAGFSGTTTTVSGLQTSTTYSLRVAARTPFGGESGFSNVVTTFTFNGGAPLGSLAGLITGGGTTLITGNLGNGRQVLFRAPPGAFPEGTRILVSSHNVPGTLCSGGVNAAVSITASPAYQPATPVQLTLSYTTGELGSISPSRAVLMRYDPDSGTCAPLETTVNAGAQTLTARLNHFSLYQVGAVTLATTADTARVFPNPFHAARDGFVTVDRVPPGARLRVFTLRGERVAEMSANASGLATWTATNGAGRPVASGLYLLSVEAGATRKILKVAVVR